MHRSIFLLILLLVKLSHGANMVNEVIKVNFTMPQANISTSNPSWIYLYQKCLQPFPKYVTIFLLWPVTSVGTFDVFQFSSNISFAVCQSFTHGRAVICGKYGSSNTNSGNLTAYGNSDGTFNNLVSYDNLQPGYFIAHLANNLTHNNARYFLQLTRQGNNGEEDFPLVPPALTGGAVGDTIEVSLSTTFSVSISQNAWDIGQTIASSLLPQNEIQVTPGDLITVTGDWRNGYQMTTSVTTSSDY